MDKAQLERILNGKARQLCSPEMDNAINEATGRRGYSGGDPDPSAYDNDADYFDAMYLGTSSSNASSGRDIYYDENTASRSQMPDKIKESMLNDRIDVTSMDPDRSVLEGMNLKPQPKRRQQPVREQVQYTPQQTMAGIDYSIIKAIVNECLKEYSTNLLNESIGSMLKTVVLKNGTISLVDNSGNIYQAKLEKVKEGNTK